MRERRRGGRGAGEGMNRGVGDEGGVNMGSVGKSDN